MVTVSEKDYGKTVFGGIHFQEETERRAFSAFSAPAQNAEDYIRNIKTNKIKNNSYCLDTVSKDLNPLLPVHLNNALKAGLNVFEKRVRGFCKEGLLLAAETRTSCPVRIVRDKYYRNSLSVKNLYPVGEGSGYAGGIVSSAADGIKTAMQFYIDSSL